MSPIQLVELLVSTLYRTFRIIEHHARYSEELRLRTVRIFQPTRNTMQSGGAKGERWRIDFDVLQTGGRWENPLMGYASSCVYLDLLCWAVTKWHLVPITCKELALPSGPKRTRFISQRNKVCHLPAISIEKYIKRSQAGITICRCIRSPYCSPLTRIAQSTPNCQENSTKGAFARFGPNISLSDDLSQNYVGLSSVCLLLSTADWIHRLKTLCTDLVLLGFIGPSRSTIGKSRMHHFNGVVTRITCAGGD